MGQERQPSDKIHATLDDLRRRLEEEREATETITRAFTIHRDQQLAAGESIASKLEKELAEARKQLAEQKESAERWFQQATAEREASRARLLEAQASLENLSAELADARAQLIDQREAAERLIHQVASERDETRDQFSDVESRMRVLEQEFAAGQQQFREQREAALALIRQLEEDRDEHRAQGSEFQVQAQRLEEELTVVRAQLQQERNQLRTADLLDRSKVSALGEMPWHRGVPLALVLFSTDLLEMSLRSNTEMLETVQEIQSLTRTLFDHLQNRDADVPSSPTE